MELNDLKIKYKSFSIFDKIIFYNVLIFLLTLIFKNTITDFFQLNSFVENLLSKPWTLITYSFLHDRPWELVFNMLILFYVSRPLINIFNNTLPLKIYFYGIISGGLLFILLSSSDFYIKIFPNALPFIIGPSAGWSALLIFLCLYMPNKLIPIAFWKVELKYVPYFIIFNDLIGLFGDNPGGKIAHFGGYILGMYFYYNLYPSNKNSLFNWKSIKSYFVTKSKMKYYKNNNVKKKNLKSDAPTQKRIDIILDKISKSGYENLSEDEKQFLFKTRKK